MSPHSPADPPTNLSSQLFHQGGPTTDDWWRRFKRLYGPVIRHWGQRAGLQPAEAEDLEQEVCLAVWRGIGTFRREDGSFTAWVCTITRHKIIDLHRRKGRQPSAVGGTDFLERLGEVSAPSDDSSDGLPPVEVLTPLLRRALDLVRAEFQEKTWQAFSLTIEGGTPEVVGARLGMSAGAVRIAKCRVLKRLRQVIGLPDDENRLC